MSLLRSLQHAGALRTLDDALASTLQRLDPITPDEVLAAAALASLAVARGHAAFDLSQPRMLVDADLPWPTPGAWGKLLAASHFVATPTTSQCEAGSTPLVLENGLVYLRRYREYERRLALQLHRIAGHTLGGDIGVATPLFAQLFPALHSPVREGLAADDAQARAVALALRRALLLVTGGPGTGKTATIARLLVLRIVQALHAGCALPRIALTAPTGRAADRMAESLHRAAQQMQASGIEASVLAALPESASTLHRLLGTVPDSPRFKHDAGNPLPFDIVVVDEASMVDLPLMCKLTEAVGNDAQLILLGDADQLPSVEAGDVLAAILGAAGTGSVLLEHDAVALQPLLGRATTPAPTGTSVLHGHRVHLTRGWRQSEALDLAPLANAVRSGDANEALRLLRSGELSNVWFHEGVDDPLQAHPQLLAHWRNLGSHTDPATALRACSQLRLLTALREGPQGASGLNMRIEAQLSGRRLGNPPTWFAGRLLLITQNSYRHQLFNGDVGICLADDEGTPLAWFPGGGEVRAFHPAALPAHESAFAMTVHKAQGSEFDEVWLQLPRQDARVLSRELLYTGLTRARTDLHLAGSAEVIATALSRHASRVSGLGWRLAPMRHAEPSAMIAGNRPGK